MEMSLELSQRPALRLELRQELHLVAPAPIDAVQGIKGLRTADEVLKKYQVPGLLIGGLAKEIWADKWWTDSVGYQRMSKHKDVDVLVLSRFCKRHPGQWEVGVDWWISHRFTDLPTNGTHVGIIWRIKLRRSAPKNISGLFLCPVEILRWGIQRERQMFGDEHEIVGGPFRETPGKIPGLEIPVMDLFQLKWQWGNCDDEISCHCKPR